MTRKNNQAALSVLLNDKSRSHLITFLLFRNAIDNFLYPFKNNM